MNKFSERLKYLRKNERTTQKELAEKMNLSTSTIGMYESGQRTPDLSIVVELANLFDVDVDFMLGLSDIKKKTIEDVKKDLKGNIKDNLSDDEMINTIKLDIHQYLGEHYEFLDEAAFEFGMDYINIYNLVTPNTNFEIMDLLNFVSFTNFDSKRIDSLFKSGVPPFETYKHYIGKIYEKAYQNLDEVDRDNFNKLYTDPDLLTLLFNDPFAVTEIHRNQMSYDLHLNKVTYFLTNIVDNYILDDNFKKESNFFNYSGLDANKYINYDDYLNDVIVKIQEDFCRDEIEDSFFDKLSEITSSLKDDDLSELYNALLEFAQFKAIQIQNNSNK